LSDPKGQLGALRQNGFLPLHKEHVGMANYGESSYLANTNLSGVCYDTFLKGFNGEAFGKNKPTKN
jgi:hypothetical protein